MVAGRMTALRETGSLVPRELKNWLFEMESYVAVNNRHKNWLETVFIRQHCKLNFNNKRTMEHTEVKRHSGNQISFAF